MKKVTVNLEQKLYVIPEGEGYSCLGFDVAFGRAQAYAAELGQPDLAPVLENKGTLAGYADYLATVSAARIRFDQTGYRMTSGLCAQLIGLEGRRVEVVDCYGARRRFRVGKSTGFIPCYLELANSRSSDGIAVMGTPFTSVRVIR